MAAQRIANHRAYAVTLAGERRAAALQGLARDRVQATGGSTPDVRLECSDWSPAHDPFLDPRRAAD